MAGCQNSSSRAIKPLQNTVAAFVRSAPPPSVPPGVTIRDLFRIVLILSMGFTVPAIAISAALPGGAMQEAARLGLALSMLAGAVALVLPRPRHAGFPSRHGG